MDYGFPDQATYEQYSHVDKTVSDRARFTAVVDIETDETFSDFLSYSVGDSSPEHIEVDADQHYERD